MKLPFDAEEIFIGKEKDDKYAWIYWTLLIVSVLYFGIHIIVWIIKS